MTQPANCRQSGHTVNTCSAQQVKLDGNSQLVFYYLLCRISSHARNAQMRAIATDVARSVKLHDLCHSLSRPMSVWVLVTQICCAKTAEPIEMPFMGLIRFGPANHVLDE